LSYCSTSFAGHVDSWIRQPLLRWDLQLVPEREPIPKAERRRPERVRERQEVTVAAAKGVVVRAVVSEEAKRTMAGIIIGPAAQCVGETAEREDRPHAK
jgi:hypothetical protein